MVFSLMVFLVPLSNKAEARSMAPDAYGAGTSPYSLDIGDLNNDGLKDVAVANFQDGTVGVYFQQSDGTLGAMTTLNSPPSEYNYGFFAPNPYGIKVSDIDNDGLNDLIVSNEFQHQAWIYRQDGAGLFLYQLVDIPNLETHPYSSPYSVDAGDLSGDNFPEIAVANYYWKDAGPSDYGSVGLINNWDASINDFYAVSFVNSTDGWISGYHSVYRTLTGGWNNLSGVSLWNAQLVPIDDSDSQLLSTELKGIDFVDSNFGVTVGDFGQIFRTINGGRYWEQAANADGGALSSVSMLDIQNGTAVGAGGTIVRTSDGGITWSVASSSTPNLNGVNHFGSQTWLVGDNGFIGSMDSYSADTLNISAPITGANLNGIDFNTQQGWIVGDNGTILTSVTSTSSISWVSQSSGTTNNLRSVSFVDNLNGWAVGDGGVILHTSNGGVNWSTQISSTANNLRSVSFADSLHGWAVGDSGTILVTDDGGATWAYQGNYGSRWFSSMYNYPLASPVAPAASHPYSAKIKDINNDGKNDITVAASSGVMTTYRMGIGAGGRTLFQNSKQNVAVGVLPADMCFFDYNHDGRTDVAITNNQGQSVSLLTQPILPTNGFDTADTLSTGEQPLGIAAADLNGDGFEDLAVANSASNSISVFTKQTASGPFNESAVFNTNGSGPYGLAIGDVNNDGKNEIVVADSSPLGGNKIEVFSPTATPGAPTVVSSTHPDSSVYYNNNKPKFQLSPPADIDGISGYYWKIDSTSNTVPNSSDSFTAGGDVSILSSLADGEYYFHAVAKDSQGNIGATATDTVHYPFKINSTPLIAAIQSPGNGSTVSGTVNIEATATTSPLFTIDKVEIYVDTETVPAAVLTASPYQYLWDTSAIPDGSHTVKIVVTDSGNRQASDTNTLTVDNTSGGGTSSSGVTRSSIELTGDQFISTSGYVNGLTYFDAGSDTWNKVGYFAPGASSSSAIYQFNLPAPSGYLWQSLSIKEDAAIASGPDAEYYAYDWATDSWEAISASGDLPFWFIQPATNKVKVKVVAQAWSVHQIKSLTLDYKYQSDTTGPQVTSVNGSEVNFANPYFSRLSFGLSEKAFLTIDIRNSSSVLVKQFKTAKSEGLPDIYWDLTDTFGNSLPPDTYTFQVTATDIAGNVTASGFGQVIYRSTAISPAMSLSLPSWDWSRIKTSSGDFNGDGSDDIAVLYNLGNSHTALYQLTSNGSGGFTNQLVWDSGPGNWSWEGSNLIAGDFNGDGKDDIAVIYGYGGSQTRSFVFASNGAVLTPPSAWWDSGPGNWDMAGTKLTAGDFNNDGKDDLFMLYGYAGAQTRAFIATSNGAAFNSPIARWDSGPGNWDWNGSKPVVGDFDNDGYADLGVFYTYSGARSTIWVFKANGTILNAPSAWWDSGPGNWDGNASKVTVGDYNNDGQSDIAVSYGYNNSQTRSFGFISNGSAFNLPVEFWDSGIGNWDWGQSKYTSGDYNGDGTDDLAIFYNYGSSTRLWVENM